MKKRGIIFLLTFLVLVSSVFAWNKFRVDSWNSGVNTDFWSNFNVGYKVYNITYGMTNFAPLLMEVHTLSGNVNESVLFLQPESQKYLRAYNYKSTSPYTQELDSLYTGELKGYWQGGFGLSEGTYYNIYGVFQDYSGNNTFFEHIVFNRSSNKLELIWSYDLGNLTSNPSSIGLDCLTYDGSYKCVIYEASQNWGSGYGKLWELDIDTQTETNNYNFNWVRSSTPSYNKPIVWDYDNDDDTEILLFGDKTADTIYAYLYSFDLTNWGLDNDCINTNCFSLDGKTDEQFYLYDSEIMLTETGTYCVRSFAKCLQTFFTDCYSCINAGALEIVVNSYKSSYQNGAVDLYESDGTRRWHKIITGAMGGLYGNSLSLAKCNDDNYYDIVFSNPQHINCLDSQTGNFIGEVTTHYGFFVYPLNSYNLIVSELDSDSSSTDIITVSGVVSIKDWERINASYPYVKGGMWLLNWSSLMGVYSYNVITGDFNEDAQMDIIISGGNTKGTKILSTIAVNQPPSLLGDGIEVDTCVPLCLNATITFYARRGIDYIDDGETGVYLGIDCNDNLNIKWSDNMIDPEISCTYGSLTNKNVRVYITDFANYPSLSVYQDFNIYTALANCYTSGELTETCSPKKTTGISGCYDEQGRYDCNIAECCIQSRCEDYTCDENNNTVVEIISPDITEFDWSNCDWKGFWTLFVQICPVWNMVKSGASDTWDWVFNNFAIFLIILLVVVILVGIARKIRKG